MGAYGGPGRSRTYDVSNVADLQSVVFANWTYRPIYGAAERTRTSNPLLWAPAFQAAATTIITLLRILPTVTIFTLFHQR